MPERRIQIAFSRSPLRWPDTESPRSGAGGADASTINRVGAGCDVGNYRGGRVHARARCRGIPPLAASHPRTWSQRSIVTRLPEDCSQTQISHMSSLIGSIAKEDLM